MEPNISLVTAEIYHIYSKSIYGYKIFNRPQDFQRILALVQYYQWDNMPPFSHFIRSLNTKTLGFEASLSSQRQTSRQLVQLVCYCIMETHIHFLLKQLVDDGITQFMQRVFNSYSLYFNLLHHRHGPLWQSRFGRRRIEDLGDLISTSHYIHSNPVKDMGHSSPADWEYSSYQEYCGHRSPKECQCQWQQDIPLDSQTYQQSMQQYLEAKGLPFQPTVLAKPFSLRG